MHGCHLFRSQMTMPKWHRPWAMKWRHKMALRSSPAIQQSSVPFVLVLFTTFGQLTSDAAGLFC